MCLAIPMQVVSITDNSMAEVTSMGATRQVALDLTPSAKVGDYVLVHAGFAIEVVDEAYAQETLELIRDMANLVDDPELAAAIEANSSPRQAAGQNTN